MGAAEKLLERFRSVPADLSWDELKRVLTQFGYLEQKGKRSRRKFKADNRPTLILHEPHPGKIVKRYAVRYVKETLESEGLL